MKFPKLKYPRLCRMLTYVVVIGGWLLPMFIVFSLPAPDIIKILVTFGALGGLLYYILKNFLVLMAMDMALAQLSCLRTARTQYTLPQTRSLDHIRSSILRYGTACDFAPIQPQPSALRYRFSNPWTIYSKGIERVVAAYEIDLLDKETYRRIFSSAKTNSNALTGKRKPLFLDKTQKKAPLHRVTVVLILAHRIDTKMTDGLFPLMHAQQGDEYENCTVPCVVDLEHGTCVFNCERIPYIGYEYAVKNRGIRIVKNLVFGGNLNLAGNTHFLPAIRDINPEDTLWDFWRIMHIELIGATKETERRFRAMAEKEIQLEDDTLYLRWDERGICQSVKLDTDAKIAKMEPVTDWYYPKIRPIGKKTIGKITEHIRLYFADMGYTLEFADTAQ